RGRGLALLAVDAGRVDQQQLAAFEGGNAEQAVARGLRTIGDDADLGTDQGVDQGGLADVGAADDGNVAGVVGAHGSCSRMDSAARCAAARRELPLPSATMAGCSSVHETRKVLSCSSPVSASNS